jgi:hypothetical protein
MRDAQELKDKLDAAHKAYQEASKQYHASGVEDCDKWDRVVGPFYNAYCKAFDAYCKGPSVPASTDTASLDISIAANTI